MNTSASEPTAQHYIPRFYLKGFTDQRGKLWVCEKFKAIRESTPKEEAHRPDYYTHAEQGERDETAEGTLQQIECRASPVIRKLANPRFVPTPEQMGHVYLFIAFMFARVPGWRENLDRLVARIAREQNLALAQSKERFQKFCAKMERETGESLGNTEELRQFILKGDYEVVQSSKAYNLGSMFKSALTVAEQLQEYGYEVLYAPPNSFFVTSDSPVFTLRPEPGKQAAIGMGFAWPRVIVHFPLNKRSCLRLRRGVAPACIKTTEYELAQINRVTMANAQQFLYSPEPHRKTSRLFDQWGCKVEPGKNAFMLEPEPIKVPNRR